MKKYNKKLNNNTKRQKSMKQKTEMQQRKTAKPRGGLKILD